MGKNITAITRRPGAGVSDWKTPLATDQNNKKDFLLRLLLGSLADAPPRVRERMIETIPTTTLSLAFYTVTLMVICITTVYITRAPWAWVWLGLSASLVAWRALVPVFGERHRRNDSRSGLRQLSRGGCHRVASL